jgi:hypothetical protein
MTWRTMRSGPADGTIRQIEGAGIAWSSFDVERIHLSLSNESDALSGRPAGFDLEHGRP